jgi:hypothetical protein
MITENNKMTPKPTRYVVQHIHEWHYIDRDTKQPKVIEEEAWVSYNTALDSVKGIPSSLSQAIHTASRYFGEIFADYGDGTLYTVKKYTKSKVKP